MKKYLLNLGIIISFLLAFLLAICFILFKIKNYELIFSLDNAIIYISHFIIFSLITILILKIKNENLVILLSTIFIAISTFISVFNHYTNYNSKDTPYTSKDRLINNFLTSSSNIQLEDNERFDSSLGYYYNTGYINHKSSVKNWNSTVAGNVFSFYKLLGIERGVSSALPNEERYLRNFLSVKYILAFNEDLPEFLSDYEIVQTDGVTTIFKNNNYQKNGTPYSYYINYNDFIKLDSKNQRKMLGIAIILSDEQISKYSSILQDITQSTFYNDLLNNNYEFKPYENNSEMHKNTSGFEYTISLDSPKLVLFTIPFEENGWTAEESGNDIPIEKVDNGLIAIKLDKGIHNVNFKYKTPGLKHGIIITIISSAIFIIYLIVIHKRKETSK